MSARAAGGQLRPASAERTHDFSFTYTDSAGEVAAAADTARAAASPIGLWKYAVQGQTRLFRWVAIPGGFEVTPLSAYQNPNECPVVAGIAHWRMFLISGDLYRLAYRNRTTGCTLAKGWKKPSATVKIATAGNRMTWSCNDQPAKVCYRFTRATGTATTTTTSAAGPTTVPGTRWDTEAVEAGLRGKNGQRFKWSCPPNGPTNFSHTWGTDVYTDDSAVCIAAVHAGVITLASGGVIVIEIRAGQSSYTGSTRNGITTYSYGPTPGSFVVVGTG